MICARCGASYTEADKPRATGYHWASPYNGATGYASYDGSHLCPACFDADAQAAGNRTAYRCGQCGLAARTLAELSAHEARCGFVDRVMRFKATKTYDLKMGREQ